MQVDPPEHWKSPELAMDMLIPGFLIVNALCLVWIGHLVVRRDYPTAAFALGLFVCFLFLLLMILQARLGRAGRHPIIEGNGTVFRAPRAMTRFLELSVGGAIVSGIIFVCYVPSGRLAIGIGGATEIYYPVIVAGLVCWLSYVLMRGRSNGWGYLKLSPGGFEAADAVTTLARGAWDDVVDVIDKAPKGTAAYCPAVMVMRDGPPQVVKSVDGYGPYGSAVYWAIRHYWLHPENRGELASGKAIERLQARDFKIE